MPISFRDEKGASLVEVLVAVALLGVGFTLVLSLAQSGVLGFERSKHIESFSLADSLLVEAEESLGTVASSEHIVGDWQVSQIVERRISESSMTITIRIRHDSESTSERPDDWLWIREREYAYTIE